MNSISWVTLSTTFLLLSFHEEVPVWLLKFSWQTLPQFSSLNAKFRVVGQFAFEQTPLGCFSSAAGCDRASPPLHTLLPPRTLRMLWQKLGLPACSSHACGAGGSSDPSQGGSWAEAAQGSQQSLSRDPVLPKPIHPSRSSSRDLSGDPRGHCPVQLSPPKHRDGGHLPAPGWICLQFCRVDRGGCGHGHQRLGGDLRLHHYHLQENGWAGIQGAMGRLCHGYRALSLQAPRGHPHTARWVCPTSPSPWSLVQSSAGAAATGGEAPSASSAQEMVH